MEGGFAARRLADDDGPRGYSHLSPLREDPGFSKEPKQAFH